MVEVEAYRRLAEGAVGRRIARVEAPDAWYLKGGLTAAVLDAALAGLKLTAARRKGKLLILDTARPRSSGAGLSLGLRFGMTGRLVLDGRAGVEELIYSSRRSEPAWERFALVFSDRSRLVMSDPRRLGGVILDPDEERLGPDAAGLTLAELRSALVASRAPLKARLLDQSRVAGIGNLLADEMLWRAGLSPQRETGSLDGAELRRLHRHLRSTVEQLSGRGGSHMGDLMPARRPGAVCPKDGQPLRRATISGRTTWWCPAHQR
ncbi:MAG: DNA-formamidopyrimidine glycosylase family protein [Acidimicrobiales bacterium]